MSRPLFALLLTALILGGAGFYWSYRQKAYRGVDLPTGSISSPKPAILEEEPTVKEELLGFTGTSAATEIFAIPVKDGKKTILFTDADLTTKIYQLSLATENGDKVLAYLAKRDREAGDTLGFLALDGSGKITTLISNFGASEAPTSSPDGKKVAYVVFSNADPDYGYSLFVMNSDGSNKRRLAKNAKLLTQPAFNPDGSRLAFLSADDSGMALNSVPVDGSADPTVIAQFPNEVLYDPFWGKTIFFSKRPQAEEAANSGEVYQISENGSGLTRLTINDSFDGRPLPSSRDRLALLRTDFPAGKFTPQAEFSIIVINLSDKSEMVLGTADGLLGWRTAEQKE